MCWCWILRGLFFFFYFFEFLTNNLILMWFFLLNSMANISSCKLFGIVWSLFFNTWTTIHVCFVWDNISSCKLSVYFAWYEFMQLHLRVRKIDIEFWCDSYLFIYQCPHSNMFSSQSYVLSVQGKIFCFVLSFLLMLGGFMSLWLYVGPNVCCKNREHSHCSLKTINHKYTGQQRMKKGGGYMRRLKAFVVTNALVVKPINDLAESPFTMDLEVKTIVVGRKEVSKCPTFM